MATLRLPKRSFATKGLKNEYDSSSEVSPIRTTIGNINRGSTPMNSIALGGINTTKIGTTKPSLSGKRTRLGPEGASRMYKNWKK